MVCSYHMKFCVGAVMQTGSMVLYTALCWVFNCVNLYYKAKASVYLANLATTCDSLCDQRKMVAID